jgi:dTDP-4-dehydrorhamnose reductase
MKLLVVGGTGMLGHKLLQKLGEKYSQTYATVRQDLSERPFRHVSFLQTQRICRNVDVLDIPSVRELVLQLQPDYILNCVGIIKEHKENAAPVPCIKINALLPHELVAMAAEYGGRVIHFSTDCVFDGKRGSYSEDDVPNAGDVYGRSKAMGELFYENALTLRTSIIGRELRTHASLLDWFLQQAGGRIKGFTRAIYSGVTTNQMANVVAMILEKFPTLSGLYQIVGDPISKYDLLVVAREKFGLEVEIEPYDGFVLDRSMKGDKFASVTGYRSPSWPDLMQDLADESHLYRSWGIDLCG